MRDENPMTPLREAALGMHEMYLELQAAGFKRSEALQLVAKMVTEGVAEGIRQANEDTEGND